VPEQQQERRPGQQQEQRLQPAFVQQPEQRQEPGQPEQPGLLFCHKR
jgi:hypothetical protein